jgi:hypothetical protein
MQSLDEHLYVSMYSETRMKLYKKGFLNVLVCTICAASKNTSLDMTITDPCRLHYTHVHQGYSNVIQFYIPAIEGSTEGKI